MKIYQYFFVLGLFAAPSGFAFEPASQITGDISIQDAYGIETQGLFISTGGDVQRLNMAAGLVEIHPPASDKDPALLMLYIQKDGKPFLAHTASISGRRTIRMGYSVCGDGVIYQSPRAANLTRCREEAVR